MEPSTTTTRDPKRAAAAPSRPRLRGPGLAAVFLAALAACGSSPKPKPDPEIERQFLTEAQRRARQIAKERDFHRRALLLDQALDEFAQNKRLGQDPKARRKAEGLANFIEHEATALKRDLLLQLQNGDDRMRAVAAAALGFTKDESLAPKLVAALEAAHEEHVRVACLLGLGQLAAPTTPLEPLTRILFDDSAPLNERRNASWALLRIQDAGAPKDSFEQVWRRVLAGDPIPKDPVIALHALRGLGLLRTAGALPAVKPYLTHPKALLRVAAVVAVARCGSRSEARWLLPLIGDLERNPNVRLAARKALKALAGGGVDFGYDRQAWRQHFGLEGAAGRS